MRKISFLLLLLCILPLSAQITFNNNRIRTGDEIVKQQVVYKDPGRSGVNVIWDFSKLEAVNPEYKLSYSAPQLWRDSLYILGKDTFKMKNVAEGELIIGREHRTNYYYHIQDSVMYCMGHENPTALMEYKAPIPIVAYPMSYGQKMATAYRSECLYSQTVPMYTYGEVQVEVDALGKMILPSKDTLEHVLRIHSIQTFLSDTIRAMDSIYINTTIETYKWYSKGYRYPVFETVRTIHRSDTLEDVFTTAFFYPPQEHYYLENDEANLALLDSLNNGGNGGITDPTNPCDGGGQLQQGDDYAYNYYPNPVTTDLYVEYLLDEPATVSLSLYDMNGRQLKSYPAQHQPAGMYEERFDMSDVPSGSYILRIAINNKIMNEKIVRR